MNVFICWGEFSWEIPEAPEGQQSPFVSLIVNWQSIWEKSVFESPIVPPINWNKAGVGESERLEFLWKELGG